ncbi:MAG: DUF1007 family protein [Campylobacterales bacterium]|nr:DUF1007 family protein [Campylobacterales bacterium]MBN2833256.1 DUF1007 family protein [Campylobacterales bacterium]
MKFLCLIVIFHLSLCAHPHFFIDTDIRIEKEAIYHLWRFDALNSKLLIFEFDTDKNRILDTQEQEHFLKEHIAPLAQNHFNLFFQSGEKEIPSKPIDFNVSIANKRLVVTFKTEHLFSQSSIFCTIDGTLYMAYQLHDVQSIYAYEAQKSDYDFCLGVNP